MILSKIIHDYAVRDALCRWKGKMIALHRIMVLDNGTTKFEYVDYHDMSSGSGVMDTVRFQKEFNIKVV